MDRRLACLSLLLVARPCAGQAPPQPAWFKPAAPSSAWLGLDRAVGAHTLTDGHEEIVVVGKRPAAPPEPRRDAPQYEAANSDAAQPLVPFPAYTSPDQQRMMSEKTDMLGLCGALGNYIQCPNLP